MGCEWAGMCVSEQLATQRMRHHQLDSIAIPSDQNLVLQNDGRPQRPEFSAFQGQGAHIIQGRTVALGQHRFNGPKYPIVVLQLGNIGIRQFRGNLKQVD